LKKDEQVENVFSRRSVGGYDCTRIDTLLRISQLNDCTIHMRQLVIYITLQSWRHSSKQLRPFTFLSLEEVADVS
jgi:hypothetical protein